MKVGILKSYKNPTMIDRIAAMSVKELSGTPIFFNIKDVDFENKIIKCKRLKNGQWEEAVSEFPDVVYNDLPQTKEVPYNLYRKLESYGIPFTTHRLGVSKSQYQRIFDSNSTIQQHLIPTHNINTADDVLMYCDYYGKIALKPNFGHRGKGVKFIHKNTSNEYTVYHHDKTQDRFERSEALALINRLLDERKHHVQKQIVSTVQGTNLPLTLRSYMGRGINGRWFNLFNVINIDYLGSSIVNPTQGSARTPLKKFLKVTYSSEEATKFTDKLKALNTQIVKEYQGNFKFLIDALGIDYVIDENNHIYIVEINGFPGMRPESGKAVYNMIRFAEHLYKQKQRK